MKYNSFLKLLLFGFICAFMASSCVKEGPMGPAGADGKDGIDGINGVDGQDGQDGTDGTAKCAVCHVTGTNFQAKQAQFEGSAHNFGTYYSRGGQCAACHSNEGFLDRVNHTAAGDIDNMTLGEQSPISCYTCHKIHNNFDATDWELTNVNPVTQTIMGYTSPNVEQYAFEDLGNSNMCLMCHQARDRGNIPSLTSTDNVSTNGHWGPHYGVQGNVLFAKAGVPIAGSATYPTSKFRHDCIRCHMHEGSHTLEVAYSSCTGCHTDIESDIEKLQHEVHDLMFELGAILTVKGVMAATMENGEVVGYSPVSGSVSADDARAVWNYMVVYQDHSYGAHYPKYVKALLTNTLEAYK